METKEIDGVEYVRKSEIENIIKQRIDKVAARANEAEEATKALQQKLDQASKSDATIDLLTQQLEKMKSELSQSEKKFSRYQAMSKHGLVDPEIVEAIEWSYEKSQSGKKKGEIVELNDWLDTIVSNPNEAPTILRPHIQNLQPQQVEAEANAENVEMEAPSTQQQLSELHRATESRAAPQTNNGVRNAPEPSNLIERGLKDSEFYAQNREEIRKAWFSRRREK